MFAKELISNDIPPLKTSDVGVKALGWMDEFKVKHLPLVNKREYLGLISEDEIMDIDQPESDLSGLKITLIRPFILENQHVYDAIKLISLFKVSIVPVLNEQQEYLGIITANTLMEYFARTSAVLEPGSIIVLELNVNDYSLTQIAQIIEGNDAKILSCYLTPEKDSTKLEVTLKVNKEDLSGITQTFNRYNYTIKALFHHSEFADDLKRRYDSFMNYIKI